MTEPEGPVPFRTFILKVANRCNIDCDYCFVFNSKDQAARRLPARMDLAVVRAAARRIGEHASAHRLRAIHVVLHGGEPLLLGVGHMTGLLQTVRDSVPAGTRVLFELQTNGTHSCGRGHTCSRGCSPSWTWPTTPWRSTTTWRRSNRR